MTRPPSDASQQLPGRARPSRFRSLVAAVAGFFVGLVIGFIGSIITGQPAWYLVALVGVPVGMSLASRSARPARF